MLSAEVTHWLKRSYTRHLEIPPALLSERRNGNRMGSRPTQHDISAALITYLKSTWSPVEFYDVKSADLDNHTASCYCCTFAFAAKVLYEANHLRGNSGLLQIPLQGLRAWTLTSFHFTMNTQLLLLCVCWLKHMCCSLKDGSPHLETRVVKYQPLSFKVNQCGDLGQPGASCVSSEFDNTLLLCIRSLNE